MKSNTSLNIKDCRKFAVSLAKKAGDFIYDNFGKVKKVEKKGFRNYVTDVDKKAEKMIISAIRERFPSHGILSEERGVIKGKSDYLWIIDPIDGTHNYMAKIPIYGVSIALYFREEGLVGVNYLPHLRELYEAEKGKGAYLNDKKIKVSNIKSLNESFILPESGYRIKNVKEKFRDFETLTKKAKKVRILGSFVFQLSYVAGGRAEGVIGESTQPWDCAASVLIIKEAGGKVTNFKGKDFVVIEDNHIIATNGKIHNQLLKLLNHK